MLGHRGLDRSSARIDSAARARRMSHTGNATPKKKHIWTYPYSGAVLKKADN